MGEAYDKESLESPLTQAASNSFFTAFLVYISGVGLVGFPFSFERFGGGCVVVDYSLECNPGGCWFGDLYSAIALFPIIIEVENYPKWKETTIWRDPCFHFRDLWEEG